ncbi:hydrogenase expression/formation protein HypE [bacterium]|nr:hydrogenase expression/formation protein HypE [bacterium]
MSDTPQAGILSCPLPLQNYPRVLLAHGGGGTLMHTLIQNIFAETFRSEQQEADHDAARLDLEGGTIAFTTDSFVVHPLFFPGGDIGSLAVHGTVNDLCMAGATPRYLSCGFIIEEGLEMETLYAVAKSMKAAADEAGVQIVTGDTKVVDRGKGDGIFINTAGVGVIPDGRRIAPDLVRPGDAILVNGDLGRHGMAIMAARESLGFEATITSDSAALNSLIGELMDSGIEIHCMRDLTRGGLVSALNEIAGSAKRSIEVQEAGIRVQPDVAALAEVLGIDPMYVANEGRFALFLPDADVDKALAIMNKHPKGEGSVRVGTVLEDGEGRVSLKSRFGPSRILPMISGEQLPRIC